jgi:hypothetical protein
VVVWTTLVDALEHPVSQEAVTTPQPPKESVEIKTNVAKIYRLIISSLLF